MCINKIHTLPRQHSAAAWEIKTRKIRLAFILRFQLTLTLSIQTQMRTLHNYKGMWYLIGGCGGGGDGL